MEQENNTLENYNHVIVVIWSYVHDHPNCTINDCIIYIENIYKNQNLTSMKITEIIVNMVGLHMLISNDIFNIINLNANLAFKDLMDGDLNMDIKQSIVSNSTSIKIEKEEDVIKLNNITNELASGFGFTPTPEQVISHLLHIYNNSIIHKTKFNWPNPIPSSHSHFPNAVTNQQSHPWPDKNGNVPCSYGLDPSYFSNPNMADNRVHHATNTTMSPPFTPPDDNVHKFATDQKVTKLKKPV